ncbi:hypothetical protein CLPUN_49750 [Clostridium puniceum]|uniref:Nucleotidase n=1 Tax=Clostridium puniceum TaxID=29367 RepID=A0A1S8T100_9CLOT|nr:hypothetical protein [Clostridium puniceum]OOM71291.1 hypothetical protein CLPUN_49750 [Clostridium puniceum]
MKTLNICIDIDGTITDPYYWLSYANKYFNLNVSESQITSYDIHKVLNIYKKDYLEFYEKFKIEIHSKQKLRNDVKKVLDILHKYNNLYFVTAREESLELVTFLYLLDNEIPFDEVFHLGTHNKVPKAKELNCNIFIEDSYDNAILLSNNGFKVILIDTNYNRLPINSSNIIRAYNWTEILQIITEISIEKEAI